MTMFSGRTTVTGPATGGLLLYGLFQKRAGVAAVRAEDQIFAMTDGFLVATMITLGEASPTLMWLDANGLQQHSGISGGNRFVIRKETPGVGGDGTINAADLGWTEAQITNRSLPRCSSGDVGSDTASKLALDVDDDATATAAFNVGFISLVACRGHRYDPLATTTVNQIYEGAED